MCTKCLGRAKPTMLIRSKQKLKKSNLFPVARGRKRLKWKALKRAGAKRSDASRGLVKGAPLKVST